MLNVSVMASATLRPVSIDRSSLWSAALRHLADAEHLLERGPHASPDQAYHLAGFAPECARKACLGDPRFDKAIGHGVGLASERALDIALALDVDAHRYELRDWAATHPRLSSWREDCRYERTGTRRRADAEALVTEVRADVERLAFALWADGKVRT